MSTLEEIKARAEAVEDDVQVITLEEAYEIAVLSQDDVPKLIAALEAVEALHRPDAETGKCEECTYARYSMASVSYPCPTVTAIKEALQ